MEPISREELFLHALEHYGTEPEYLWVRSPTSAVLRCQATRKWYAIVMEVSAGRLGLSGEGMRDVLNVRCDPILVGALRGNPGFLPAYHMNKDRWLSLLLDGSVPREQLFDLLEWSYGAARGLR